MATRGRAKRAVMPWGVAALLGNGEELPGT